MANPEAADVMRVLEIFRNRYHAEGGIKEQLKEGRYQSALTDLSNFNFYLDGLPPRWMLGIHAGTSLKANLEMLCEELKAGIAPFPDAVKRFEAYLAQTKLPSGSNLEPGQA